MEQIVVIEQLQADLNAIVAQAKQIGAQVVVSDDGNPQIKMLSETAVKQRVLNFGFMNEVFDVPDDFDRMNEDEIYAMFAGEYGENLT